MTAGPVSFSVLEAAAEALAEKIGTLSRRLDALEGATSGKWITWAGRWDAGTSYARGAMTTHGGSLWIADRRTDAVPGASSDWSRMLKADRRGNFTEEPEQ